MINNGDFKYFIMDWEKENKVDDYTISLVPKKELRQNFIFSDDWQTNEICKRYCNIEDLLTKYSVSNKEDLNTRLDKADMFDYLMQFIKNVDVVDYNEEKLYHASFVNDTPWLNCIELDKSHFLKLKQYAADGIHHTKRDFPYITIIDKYGSVIRAQQSSANLSDIWLFNDKPAIEDNAILLTPENLEKIIEFKKKLGEE